LLKILRLQEQLGERRVSLVRAARIETYFGVTGEVKLARPAAVVDDRDYPDFRVVVRRDANGQARLKVAIPAEEVGPPRAEDGLIVFCRTAQRLMAD
jgi:hypothetical protein